MNCPRCQAENADAARFCGRCGGRLSVVCAACGAKSPSENRFCGQCGTALDASVGELKQVTLLFCDMVDSTGLAERLGPEAMHELLRAFLDDALAAVHRYGGTAPQFLGDGFMALFGAPIADEDHVRRALLAALAIRDAVRVGGRTAGEPDHPAPNMRIGIHTGLVVFGAVAANLRMDRTAIGDAANVAARLQQAAEPGVILISDETHRLAQGHAQVEPAGPLRLKGKAETVAAYRLVGYSHRGAPLDDAASSNLRKLIGRDRELALLDNLVRALASGRGGSIGLIGEPGIGKSRLLTEFRRRIAPDRVTWVDGRCVSYGTTIPYMLVLDLLRGLCGIIEADPQNVVAEKLRDGLQRVGMDPREAAPPLLRLLGIDDSGAASHGQSREALKAKTVEILCRLGVVGSRDRPLALAIEDVQWIDTLSEEVLASIAARLPELPILIITTSRPEYRPPWLGGPDSTEIELQPLDRKDSLEVVRSVLAGSTDAERLTAAIVERADGNPLFLEQLALQAAEAGHPPSPDAVPSTVRDVLMARIDRLPEETKRLLQTAAVIGREFSLPLLDAVRPESVPAEPHLRELRRLEFIDERPGSQGSAFVFRHALTQETAYANLLARYRRLHHAAVAQALERMYEGRIDEVSERLAFHFGRSEIADKAVDYAILAGEKAQRRWANAEALADFDAALARLGEMPDTRVNRLRRIDAVLKQAEVRYALGQSAQHLGALDGIRGLVEESGDARRRATWHYWTGFLHSLTGGRPEFAIEHCREATRIASRAGLDDIDAFATACLAQVYMVAGRPREGIAAGERALENFEARGNRWWASRTLWLLSSNANYLGAWTASVNYCRRGLDHGFALDDLRLKAVGWSRLAAVHIQLGDPTQGIAYCDEALALRPIARDGAWARVVRGYGKIKAGCVDEGIAELDDALAWFEGSRMRWTHIIGSVLLAEGHLARGDGASARPLIERVLQVSRETGYRQYEGRGCWLMAECLAEEAPAAAEDHIDTALCIFQQIGARNDLGKALMTQSTLRRRSGDIEAARQLLDEAGAIFRELGSRGGVADVAATIAALDRDAKP